MLKIDQNYGVKRKKLIEVVMKPQKKKKEGNDLFLQRLDLMLDQRNELYRMAHALDWEFFEGCFEAMYSEQGRPAHPIRLMVGLLLLKQLKNLSDEEVCAAWKENPYMQYFCGEEFFRWEQPCAPSDLVYFRKRIGEGGVEKILQATVNLHREKVEQEQEVVADTTVQEANVTYPTDTKLRRKVIEKMWKLGEEAGVKWDHSYVRVVPKLLRVLRTRSNRLKKQRRKAERKLKTLAGRLIREYERKASPGWKLILREELDLYKQVLAQKRHDRNKVYSLHDPGVNCIAKGKAHKKYEFGRKGSVVMLRDSGVIVGAKSFEENLYDGDTLDAALWQVKQITGKSPESCLVDLGYRGRPQVMDTRIEMPKPISKNLSPYHRKKERMRRARRSAIEPVIGHLKNDYRMARCFLKGTMGADQNIMLAAAAWNLRKWVLFGVILNLVQNLLRQSQPHPLIPDQSIKPLTG